MKKLYSGSCHCGSIRFRSSIDLAPPPDRSPPARPGIWWTTTFRCNCSYCTKARYWKAFVPAAEFEWLSGREDASNYQFGARLIDHFFCRTCGMQTFARASFEDFGGEFYCVNIACLDDVPDAELAAIPVTYEDGRANAWDREPEVTSFL
jgi:hypothetical protein